MPHSANTALFEPAYPALVISFDFELHWGVAERVHGPEHPYWRNLLGAREAVPQLLALFEERGIHATWATVGFLFAHGRRDLEAFVPERRPQYVRPAVDNYRITPGESEEEDPVHFAPRLIAAIRRTPGQELASHTFSHYYCNEPGQDEPAFLADLQAAQAIARRTGSTLRSLVFSRNQVRSDYLAALPKAGLEIYRGNPPDGGYGSSAGGLPPIVNRGKRFLDTYLTLSGHHTVPWADIANSYPHNVRASRFLRPYNYRLRLLEPLKQRRIIIGLRAAAQRNEIFHLWWHPHNFGAHTAENLRGLERILEEYRRLHASAGMRSLNMSEAADEALRMVCAA